MSACDDARHEFRPDRKNRTKCDICGRTAGVATHKAAQQGSGPRVMRHRPLLDCHVTGAHYCHSRFKGGAK